MIMAHFAQNIGHIVASAAMDLYLQGPGVTALGWLGVSPDVGYNPAQAACTVDGVSTVGMAHDSYLMKENDQIHYNQSWANERCLFLTLCRFLS